MSTILKDFLFKGRHLRFEGMIESFLLEEGLTRSYDIKKLIPTLTKEFGDRLEVTENKPLFDWSSYTITIDIKDYKKDIDASKLVKILDLFGYYVTKFDLTTSPFNIEPRHAIIMNNKLKEFGVNYFYHITQKSKLNKIMKYGLAPRESQTTFYHPDDRIYLIYSPNFLAIKIFKRHLAEDKNVSINNLVILKTPFDDSYKYFLDDMTSIPRSKVYAVFVLKNIPPNKLEVLE